MHGRQAALRRYLSCTGGKHWLCVVTPYQVGAGSCPACAVSRAVHQMEGRGLTDTLIAYSLPSTGVLSRTVKATVHRVSGICEH